ncbi:MAG TPA: thiamine diphosphokinase [Syntrophales bacterium]|nr:thiamine diphosphokinase [Syntrophales bacterium]HOM07301.1 thiamine diphosphokinase [Syntrophales bacterium]HOO00174.1 thiamine diphosphokinase [Syntrophales bacterium]HPC01317.1 thiamine diphosphokinase [Syntrophales bacterium]HPQ06854.1 thiamine diphosphokinase [Syntrophales bacterium]
MYRPERVVILAAGPLHDPAVIKAGITALAPEKIICADGGAVHALAMGLCPSLVIGDLDSLPEETQTRLREMGCELRRYPAAKDDTDTSLALEEALRLRPREIFVFGATGRRLDHTLANIALLLRGVREGIPVRIVDEWCEIFAVTRRYRFRGRPGERVSIFPLAGEALGVTLEGFEYPLRDGVMPPERPYGISNRIAAPECAIAVASGVLLVLRYFGADRG